MDRDSKGRFVKIFDDSIIMKKVCQVCYKIFERKNEDQNWFLKEKN